MSQSSISSRGITIWFTGLPASGKSSLSKAYQQTFNTPQHPICLLDGDDVRRGLSSDLDFSPEGRSENIRRVAEIALLLNNSGITALCALISPSAIDREKAKLIIGSSSFYEVHVSTPLQICEFRDPLGLYKKARKGEIPNFTGVNASYDIPKSPTCSIDTSNKSIDECVQFVHSMLPREQIFL